MINRVFIDAKDRLDVADELEQEFHQAAKDAVGDAAGLLLDEIRVRLRLRHGTKRTAAPPGEPPESDTDALAASFKKITPRVKGHIATSGIRSNDPGGNRLEHGFTDLRGVRTFPHPFLNPSIAATEGPIEALLRERLG